MFYHLGCYDMFVMCVGRYLHLCENVRRDLQLVDVEVRRTCVSVVTDNHMEWSS